MLVPPFSQGSETDLSEVWDKESPPHPENNVAPRETRPRQDTDSENMFAMELPPCAVLSTEEIEPVQIFVAGAVCYPEGAKAPQGYRAVMDCLRKRDDPSMLRKVLIALRTAGSTLNHLTGAPKRHAHLLHLIFRLDPFEPSSNTAAKDANKQQPCPYGDFSVANAHLHLLVALVSANSVFLTPAMNAVWRLLQTRATTDRTTRLHATLSTLLRLVPKGNTDLFPVLASSFPFRTKQQSELEWYAQQCLFVTKYVPSVHGRVLGLLVDKCLEMDVEIKIDDGGEVTIEKDDDMFELELEASSNQEETEPTEDAVGRVDEMADKLDALMLILFNHIHEATKTDVYRATFLFSALHPVFESTVMTTHKSKFVQFVMFYICGQEVDGFREQTDRLSSQDDDSLDTQRPERLYRTFCSSLIEVTFDPYRATVTRQSAACYLASFVSRASFVCAETVCESLCALLRWAEAYMASIQLGCRAQPSDARDQCEMHSLFYTICQAAFYIMCFRGTDAFRHYLSTMDDHSDTCNKDTANEDGAINDRSGSGGISSMRWDRICGHSLQPLRYCLESVRGEFLHVASLLKLLDAQLLDKLAAEDRKMASSLRRRKKASLIVTATTLDMRRKAQGVGGLGRGRNPLDSFFPFDPYLLRRSHEHINQFYRDWTGSTDETVVYENSSDIPLVEEHNDDGRICDDEPAPQSAGSLVDFSAMSLSPSSAQFSDMKTSVGDKPSGKELVGKGEKKDVPQTERFKRSRAPSIEHGSW